MTVRIVGILVVRNEDVFVEHAIRNVADFCDEIYVLDHLSTDRTPAILKALAGELEHLSVHRSARTADGQSLLEPHAGKPVWVLRVDGDELFDPEGLARLRTDLLAGAHADVFDVKAHVLNCDRLENNSASGWMAPPSRAVTKLFNFNGLEYWRGALEPLHAGDRSYKPGFEHAPRALLWTEEGWETDPLRMLHVCFLRRSSLDPENATSRLALSETLEFDLGLSGRLKRLIRRPKPNASIQAVHSQGKNWKQEWYTRGERVTVDATPFFGPSPAK